MALAFPQITRISKQAAENALFVLFLLMMTILISVSVSPSIVDPYSDIGSYRELWDGIALRPLFASYEPGFVLFVWAARHFFSFDTFLWLIKAILLCSIFILVRTFIKSVLLSFLVSLSLVYVFPPFLSLTEVAIRQGLATSVFLIFLSWQHLACVKLRNVFIPMALMSAFHYSSAFIMMGLIAFIFSSGRKPFYAWMAILALYMAGLSGQIGLFVYERLPLEIFAFTSNYAYRTGFKPTFFALGVFPVILGFVSAAFGLLNVDWRSMVSSPLFRLYFILNALAMCMSQFPFHDRFFIWSWAIVPFLVLLVFRSMKTRVRPR